MHFNVVKGWVMVLLSGTLISGCFFDAIESSESVVLLEDVIYTSGNSLRLLGRIYSADGEIEDHGFYLSETSDFESPVIRSLGGRSDLGLFLTEFNTLAQQTIYHYKAFIVVDGKTIFSDTSSVTTYDSRLYGFSPAYGNAGQTLTIEGSNLTSSIKVFFGGREAEILRVISDFRIEVLIPENGSDPVDELTVQLDDQVYSMGNFEYVSGKWTRLIQFPEERFYDVSVFQTEEQVVIGMGSNNEFNGIRPGFLSLNLNTLDYFVLDLTGPTPVVAPFYTASGYFGSGANEVIRISESVHEYVLSNEFWKYENGTFTSRGLAPDFLYSGTAFDLNNTLYLMGGLSGQQNSKMGIFSYTGKWNYLGVIPFQFFNQYPHSTVNGKQWFLNSHEEFWEFDPADGSFTNFGQFDKSVGPHGKMVTLGEYVYFGLFQGDDKMWRMHSGDRSIIDVAPFPGDKRALTVAGFTYDGILYFIKSPRASTTGTKTELWKLEPNLFQNQ